MASDPDLRSDNDNHERLGIAVEINGSPKCTIGPDGTDKTNRYLLEHPAEIEAYRQDRTTMLVVVDGRTIQVDRDGPKYRCHRSACDKSGEWALATACLHRAVAAATVPSMVLCKCGSPFVIQSIDAATPGAPEGHRGRKNTYFCARCGEHTHTDVVDPGGIDTTAFRQPRSVRF